MTVSSNGPPIGSFKIALKEIVTFIGTIVDPEVLLDGLQICTRTCGRRIALNSARLCFKRVAATDSAVVISSDLQSFSYTFEVAVLEDVGEEFIIGTVAFEGQDGVDAGGQLVGLPVASRLPGILGA